MIIIIIIKHLFGLRRFGSVIWQLSGALVRDCDVWNKMSCQNKARLMALLAKLEQQYTHFNVVYGCCPAGLCLML